jgi:hypothetical protein
MKKRNRLGDKSTPIAKVGMKDAPVAASSTKMSVSQETLELLQQGRDSLLQRRQQLAAEMQQIDVLIQRQEGGITLLEQLLAGQEPAGEAEGTNGE